MADTDVVNLLTYPSKSFINLTDTSEESNSNENHSELSDPESLLIPPESPKIKLSYYDSEAVEVLKTVTEPEEDKWYDYIAAPFRGIQDQLSNTIEATLNPVDQLADALSGGYVDVANIRTSSDRYRGAVLQLEHQLGEAAVQVGTAGAAAFFTAPAGGTGAIPVAAVNMAGQALEKYKASFVDALQAGLSMEAARKEATLKTWDSLPAAVIEQLIPFGKIPGVGKLISKGAAKVLPNGAVKIINKPLAKAIIVGGATEGLSEGTEEIEDIAVEEFVGERLPTTLGQKASRTATSAGMGTVVGGFSGGMGNVFGMDKNERTIRRTKEGYEKFTEPKALPAPTEPTALPAPTEPKALPAHTEPKALPAPTEPTALPAPTEPKALPAPTEPKALPAPDDLIVIDNSTGNPIRATDIPVDSDGTYKLITDYGEGSPLTAKEVKDLLYQQIRDSTKDSVVVDNRTGNPIKVADIPVDSDGTYSLPLDNSTSMILTASEARDMATQHNQASSQQQGEPQENYDPIDEEETIKVINSLEQAQREWFDGNEVLDSKGNKVSYEDITDRHIYSYTDAKGRKKQVLGVELLNVATGDKYALVHPKGLKIIDNETGTPVRLSNVPLGSKKTFTVSIDGYVMASDADAKAVHRFAGNQKHMQIYEKRFANGTLTTFITTPANNQVKGAEANLTQEITNGSTQTVITENPALLGDTKKGTVQRAKAVQKQKKQTRKKAIRQSNKKDGVELSIEAEDNQSEVPGSGNQSTFGQTTETNDTQQTKMGKPDTIETDPEEAIRVMQVDLDEADADIAQQEKKAGVKEGESLEDLIKAGKHVPPTLYKNKIRHLVNKLAGIMDTAIFDKLGQKGFAGSTFGKQVMGATKPKLGYARVRDSMDYITALHELAHNVWQTGSDLDSPEIDIHPMVIGIKELARKRGLTLDNLNSELQTVFPVLHSKLAIQNYDSIKVPEEIFCEVYANYVTNSDMAAKIKEVAPTVASLIDEHIDSMPKARRVVDQLRTLTDAFNKLDAKQKVLSNLQTESGEQTTLQKIKAWFGQDWLISRVWNRWIDNTHFLRRSINKMYKNNPNLPDTIRYLPDAIEYILATESYDARAFLDGNGTTADGTDLGRQFKSIALMQDNLLELAKSLVNDKKDVKEINAKVKEINDNFLAYLYAMDTLGSYTGNAKVMENFRNLVSDTKLSLKETHALMSVISSKFWDQFKNTDPITKYNLTKEQIRWAVVNNIDVDNTIDQINFIKKNIKLPADNVLEQEALDNIAYKHAVNRDGTVDLAKARATWLYKNYHLPAFDTVAETGITLSDALDVIMETESDPLADTYKQMAADYYTYQDSLLNFVKAYSKGGGAWVDSIKENGHAYYIPLLRMFENNEEQTDYPEVNNRLYKMFHRLGSQRPVRNIWDSTIKQTNALVYGAHQAKVKEAFVELAETVGGGKYVREITEKKAKASFETKDLLMQIKSELEARKNELINQGMDPKDLPTGTVEALYNSLYKANLARLNLFAPENNYKALEAARQFTVWDTENNTLRYFEVDRSVWTAFKKEVIDPNSGLGKINKFLGFFMNLARKGLIEWNPVFNFMVNPIRDAVTSTIKGDVKLVYLPNHPNIEAFIPFNRSLGSVMSLLTDYYQYIFRPDIMKAKYDLLDQLGQGFNMFRSTYTDLSKQANAGKIIPMNPIRRLFTFRMWLGEEARTTDKWGRIRELEAYMKRNKISPERAEISASRAASLTLTKGTLVGLGIDNTVLKNILTSEQLETFNKTKNKDYVDLDITKDQQTQLDNLVRDNKRIAENIKNQQLDFHTRVQLSRAVALATTDFARGGLLTRSLNHVSLFSSASTNGLVQWGEVLRRKWYGGQRADVLGYLLEKFLLGYLAEAFGFNDDRQTYKDAITGIRRKIGPNMTWKQPAQFPDQIMELLGTHVYRSLYKENPESVTELIKQSVIAANPYSSFGGLIGIWSDARKSVVDIPGVSMFDASKNKNEPHKIITDATGRLAIQLSKWTGVPAAKVQYLMDNAGLRFWDKMIESSLGFDSGTYTTTGEWISTSGGFIKNIMQNLGINKELYKTSYEVGLEKLSEEADKRVIEASKSGDIPDDLINKAIDLSNANKILDAYDKIGRIARDSELKTEVRTKKAEAAKELYNALVKDSNISPEIIKAYAELEAARYTKLRKYYKELDKQNAANPDRPSGELQAFQESFVGKGIELLADLISTDAAAEEIPTTSITKDTNPVRYYHPGTALMEDGTTKPNYSSIHSNRYGPNHMLGEEMRRFIKSLSTNYKDELDAYFYEYPQAKPITTAAPGTSEFSEAYKLISTQNWFKEAYQNYVNKEFDKPDDIPTALQNNHAVRELAYSIRNHAGKNTSLLKNITSPSSDARTYIRQLIDKADTWSSTKGSTSRHREELYLYGKFAKELASNPNADFMTIINEYSKQRKADSTNPLKEMVDGKYVWKNKDDIESLVWGNK